MAVSTLTTPLPRRAVIAGAAALMATPAIATVSRSTPINSIFAEKLKAFREAHEARLAATEESAQRVEALGPCPSLPRELREAFTLPDKPHSAKPGAEGWTVEALEQIKGGRYWDRKAGWIYFLAAGHPIRVRAGELLAMRLAYDAAWGAYDDAATAITDGNLPLFEEEDRRAFDLMRHPASSLAEIREKITIAQETYLFDHDAGDEARDAILRDVLAIATEEGRA